MYDNFVTNCHCLEVTRQALQNFKLLHFLSLEPVSGSNWSFRRSRTEWQKDKGFYKGFFHATAAAAAHFLWVRLPL
jgi:hypothetical protein